jgi:[ribosomal protein S5]-alanine N-acetyltransferase
MITELDFIDFKCPACGGSVSFPQQDKGLARECPTCMESVIVPDDGAAEGRRIPLPVTTPRLGLRRFKTEDWKDLMECRGDDNEDEERVLQWLEADRQIRLTTPGQVFRLGIELQEGGKLIGFFSLTFTDAERLQATVDTVLNQKYEQPDLRLEAFGALLGFCFEGIKLHRLSAMCDSQDAAGRKLLEDVGMRHEAEFAKDRRVMGEWRSSAWYATLAEDYVGKDANQA